MFVNMPKRLSRDPRMTSQMVCFFFLSLNQYGMDKNVELSLNPLELLKTATFFHAHL